MRAHPHVNAVSLRLGIGYEDALALCRSQANDPLAVAAVKEIQAADVAERERATAKNSDMMSRLADPQDGKIHVGKLIATLADDPELETWLLRRVNLTRAHGKAPADDEHPENE